MQHDQTGRQYFVPWDETQFTPAIMAFVPGMGAVVLSSDPDHEGWDCMSRELGRWTDSPDHPDAKKIAAIKAEFEKVRSELRAA